MTAYRIKALIVRYLLIFKRDINRLCDISIWPIFDMVMWGFVGVWISYTAHDANAALVPLLGMFFWQGIFNQTNMGISVSLLDELFGRNLSSLIASPLRLSEWLCALMCIGIMRMVGVMLLGAAVLKFCFGVSIFIVGKALVPIVALFILAGWSIGCITSALILVWGNQASAFIWATWIFTAFCGVYSPADTLPPWMQAVGMCLPMTYPLRIAYAYLMTSAIDWSLVTTGLVVNGCYSVASIMLLMYMFKRARRYGVSRLEVD